MCGIIAVIRKDGVSASRQTLKRYHKQKTRGQQGFGYVALRIDGIIEHRRFQWEVDALSAIESLAHPTILFHHRFPTSVLNIAETAHPIKVSHESLKHDYYVLHNGWITNASALRDEHLKMGFKYTTDVMTTYKACGIVYNGTIEFNDSEALAIELALTIEGKQEVAKATGSVAHITLQVDKHTNKAVAMFYGTNGGNQLTLVDDTDSFVLASEGGRAIVADTTYRRDMVTGDTVIMADINLIPHKTYKAPTTYDSTYAATSKETQEDVIWSTWEEELSELEDQIIGARGEAAYYVEKGDMEGEEAALQELRELLEEKDNLESKFLREMQ